MYLFTIGPFSIDESTATLIGAIIALAASLIVAFLGATYLETRRQNSKHETEKKALRDALYNEIGWTVRAIVNIITIHEREPTFEFQKRYFWATWEEFRTALSEDTCTEVYDYTREHPVLFYELKDAQNIEFFYREIKEELFKRLDAYAAITPEKDREDQGQRIRDFMHGEYQAVLQDATFVLDTEKLRDVTIGFIDRVLKREEQKRGENSKFIDELYVKLGRKGESDR